MQNSLQIFNNPEFGNIRVTGSPDDPLFCLADICRAVDLDPSAVMRRLDKGVISSHPLSTAGGTQMANFVNEDGLYDVILDSRKPEAKRFRKWITSEVLPSIRKTGSYSLDYKKIAADPEFIIQIGQALKAEQEKVAVLTEENAVLHQQVAELTPKASYYDVVLNCKDLVSVSKIAKDYGFSAVKFNKLLHKLGVQYKQGTIWLLYQKYANLGWTSTKTHIYLNSSGETQSCVLTYWSPKGRLGLYDLLKSKGYLPLIEQDEQDELYEEC